MVDLNGNLSYANPAFLAMFGYTGPQEVLGRTVTAFSETPFWVVRALAQGLAHGSFAGEFKGRRKDGSLFEVRVSGNPIYDAKHHLLGGLVTFEDITAKKQSEERQKLLIKKLHLMNSITRHDIKNQLTALTGFLDLCRASTDDAHLNSLLDKEFRIVSTINHQLDFAKYYQEIGISEPGWYRLADVIEKAGRQLFLPSLDIRPPVCRIECFADPLIQKVFSNLFDNSLRHGGDVTRILVDAQEDPDGMHIIVEDDGRGIPYDIKERIFERGFGKNTGFGLFLSREILAITCMSISETGDVGSGARFVILVPREMYRIIQLPDS
jgi:PAS domain S-box-containing protein